MPRLARLSAKALFKIKATACRALEWLLRDEDERDKLFDAIVRQGCGGCPNLSIDGECMRIPMPLPCQVYKQEVGR